MKAVLVGILLVPATALGQARTHHERLPDRGVLRPAPTPTVSIGQEGGPEYELFQVRGAVRLSDGRIAVLNSGSSEVRIFSPRGRFERSHGGPGQGPGEFARAERLFLGPGDSLFVWDSRNLRTSVVAPDAGFVGTIRLDPNPQAPRLEGVGRDGSLLVVAMHFDANGGKEIGRIQESRFLYDRLGAGRDSLGVSPGMSGVIRASSQSVEVVRPLLPFTTTYALGGGKLWVETGEAYRVEVLDLATGARRVITWTGPDLRMKDSYVDAVIRDQLSGVQDATVRDRIRTSLESRPVGPTIPATQRVLADPSGRGWVELARVPGDDGPGTWLVFSPEGALQGRVAIPRRMTVHDILDGAVLVVERDELDLEHVRLYPLAGG